MKSLNRILQHLFRLFILYIIGGTGYMLIEILWRGRTHWTMGLLGGLCFAIMGLINEIFTYNMYMLTQCVISAIVITIFEFITGCIVNLHFGLGVWDYSNMPFNLLGQICLLFSFLWVLLSAVGIYLDDYLRYKLFKEEMPKYKWFIFRNCNK